MVFASQSTLVASSSQKEHWAAKRLQLWISHGFIDENDNIELNSPISRAQWVKLINTSLGYSQAGSTQFRDVQDVDWFANDVRIAVAAGYISGYSDGTFRPNQPISREEAATMLQRILWLPSESFVTLTDSSTLASWSRGAVGALAKQSLITGSGGKFHPKAKLNWAEAITLLDNVRNKPSIIIDKAGTYGPKAGEALYPTNITLNAPGITLTNTKVNGDLTIGSSVDDGDIYLDNVNVSGTTYVNGGGENSVYFKNTVMVTVVVDKKTGAVRIAVEGASQIGTITLETGASIETRESSSVNTVSLSEKLPADTYVRLSGSFETVDVLAQSIVVDIPDGSIEALNVAEGATSSEIKTQKETSILNLVMNAAVKILGEAKISNAVVNADGIEMEKAPEKVEVGKDVAKDVQVTIGGQNKPVGDNQQQTPVIVVTPPSTPSDTTPPTLILIESTVNQGQDVHAISNESGAIYIVPFGTTRTVTYLDLAVNSGLGVKQANTASEYVTLSTTELTYGSYSVVASDLAGNTSYIPLLIQDPNSLHFDTLHIRFNDMVSLVFNNNIVNNLADLETLKAAITFSSDNGVTYNPLGPNDVVTVFNNKLEISFENEYSGLFNKIKLAAGSLKDVSGNVQDTEVITWAFRAGINLTIHSHATNPIVLDLNETVSFSIDEPGMVYFVPAGTSGVQTEFDAVVVAGRGKAIEVTEEDVNETLTLDPNGLAPGIYFLLVWNGKSERVEYAVSEPLPSGAISYNNEPGNDHDTITISGLSEGDVIKLYSGTNNGPGTIITSRTVAPGETSIIITDIPLNDDIDEIFYFTITNPGKGESSPIGIGYSKVQ